MAHKAGKKEESHARILASAGRVFRRHGYGGVGVDGLAKEAGVTSGAFYAHFTSKAAAFRQAVVAGMQDLRAGIEQLRGTRADDWRRGLVDIYMGDRVDCDMGESCALQNLAVEVARSDEASRSAFERELRGVIEAAASGMEQGTDAENRRDAIALLSLLTGGVSVARAVQDAALRDEIVAGVRHAAEVLIGRPAAQGNG